VAADGKGLGEGRFLLLAADAELQSVDQALQHMRCIQFAFGKLVAHACPGGTFGEKRLSILKAPKKRRPPTWGGTPLSILVRQKILQKERHGRRAFASVNQCLAIPVPCAMKIRKSLIINE